MSDPLEFIPGYVSPLTDNEHARIGRVALLWGQIEHYVEILLCHATKQSWNELRAIQVAEKPIGAKVDYLNVAKSRLNNPKLEEKVGAFCALIHETKIARNHVFHGMWGWRTDSRTKSVTAAARKTSQPAQPFKASQLPALEKKLCRCSRMGADLAHHFWGFERIGASRYLHGASKDIEPWFDQWLERNPLDDAALDRNGKAGQLPRLARPFPRK
jgi:hypothetical protein